MRRLCVQHRERRGKGEAEYFKKFVQGGTYFSQWLLGKGEGMMKILLHSFPFLVPKYSTVCMKPTSIRSVFKF